LKENEPKGQHTVPRQYLEKFANERNMINIFDKETKKTYKTSPKNATIINDYYTFIDLDGNKDYGLEKYFSQVVEGNTHELIDKLIDGQSINIDERYRISQFVAYQHIRTPEYWKSVSDRLDEKTIRFLEMCNLEVNPELIPVFPKAIDDIRLMSYLQMWVVFEAPKNYEFITTGNPVVLDLSEYWFCADKFFPLSPKHCLVITNSPAYNGEALMRGKATELQVSYINNVLFSKSRKWIISNNDELAKKFSSF
jgi:hypothetical protein